MTTNDKKLIVFLSTGGFASAWQATSLGVTAQSMGTQVTVVLGFAALEQFLSGSFGAEKDHEQGLVEKQRSIGAATPTTMLESLRALGGRVVACDTTMRMVTENEHEKTQLDEVLGLPSIWAACRGAQLLSF